MARCGKQFTAAESSGKMAGMEMLLSDEGFRHDGRRPNELRRIQCRMGVFGQADGSAYIEHGNTKVLAAVYGPHEVSVGDNMVCWSGLFLKASHS